MKGIQYGGRMVMVKDLELDLLTALRAAVEGHPHPADMNRPSLRKNRDYLIGLGLVGHNMTGPCTLTAEGENFLRCVDELGWSYDSEAEPINNMIRSIKEKEAS